MANIDTSSLQRRHRLTFQVGLQLKSVLILSCLMVVVTAVGGWLYYNAAAAELRKSDYRHAEWMGQALAMAARQDIRQRSETALQRLVGDYIRNGNVLYVSLLDDQGRILACASRDDKSAAGSSGVNIPLAFSGTLQDSDNILVLAKPVVLGKSANGESAVIGSVRLVLDTSATAASLAKVQRQVQFVGAIIIIFALPLGYFMVWRLLIQP
ncbi:MAG: hypothetical protein EHM48_10020, partial [Planctomycetaceae bacterium]